MNYNAGIQLPGHHMGDMCGRAAGWFTGPYQTVVTAPVDTRKARYRASYLRWAAPVAVILLVNAPRIQLAAIAGSSVRVDDLILLALVPGIVSGWSSIETPVRRTGIGLIVGIGIVSGAIAALSGRVSGVSSVLYSFRPLEYWLVLPAVIIPALGDPARIIMVITRILAFTTVIQVVFAAIQLLTPYAIGFSKASYLRGAGLTAGPYELGAICACLAIFWFGKNKLGFVVLALIGVILSNSRISLAAVAITLAVMALIRLQRRRMERLAQEVAPQRRAPSLGRIVCWTLAALTLTLTAPAWSTSLLDPVASRASSTSLTEAWMTAEGLAAHIPPLADTADYSAVAYDSIGQTVLDGENGATDQSNVVRFFRWNILLRSIDPPSLWLFGLGPSFAGPSVDGAILRVYIETGLLGLVAWSIALMRVANGSSTWLKGVVGTLVIGSLFIDLPFSMRTMVVFWVLLALDRVGQAVGRDAESPVLTDEGPSAVLRRAEPLPNSGRCRVPLPRKPTRQTRWH